MRAIGIILAGGNSEKLGELTALRARSAMPVGSCYRAIDFPLSNMTNSGISKVAVITQYNSRSLHDHLSSAKWWNLGRKQGGMFIFTPYLTNQSSAWFRGTADSMFQNISYLKRSNEPYVIIASGDAVYKMDYRKIIEAHEQNEADMTMVCRDELTRDVRDYGVMTLDDDCRLLDFEEKPLTPSGNTISLGIYIIQRKLLIKLLEAAAAEGRYDFVRDIVSRYRKQLKIYGYKFTDYWSNIASVSSYYQANMDFLDKEIRDNLLNSYPYIKTKPKDEPPVKYNVGSHVVNTLIGAGGIINGAVEHSVLFRKVYTGEGSFIKNSIIMEGCYIGNNSVVENVILDKEVVLSDGKHIVGPPGNPIVIKKNSVM